MIFFRLREMLKGEQVEKLYQQLLQNESFSKDQILKWQKTHLSELLTYISNNNPFYSKYIFDNKININEPIDSIGELLSCFPVINKQFIKRFHNEWLSKHLSYTNLNLSSTSGSSGIPFKFYQTKLAADYKTASKFRLYKRHNIKISDKQLCYGTGFNSDIKSKMQRLKVEFNNRYVNNRYFIDVSSLNSSSIKEEIDRINSLPIRSVWGYPSTLYEIANYSLYKKYPIYNKNLKAVIYSGEGHDSYMDSVVRDAFNVKTIDEYNSLEGFIAGSCKVDKLHLNEDTAIFEVLMEDGSINEYGYGELLITSLFSKDFPFIRYKNGDLVSISRDSCICGSCFKVLDYIEGRSSCFIYNGDVKVPHATCSHYLAHSDYRSKVEKFQIEQKKRNNVVVKIVLTDKLYDCTGLENLYRNLFNKIEVEFLYVNDIPKDKSGKYKDVINSVVD